MLDTLERETLPLYTSLLRSQALQDPRTQQSHAGDIGPSDIGFCRQKVALMLKGVQQSDSKSIWAAEVGRALHAHVLAQFKEAAPDRFLTETHDLERLTVPINLSSGVSIVHPGHPDMVDLELNAVIDIKTVDGLSVIRRSGPSTSQRFQRWLYGKGCVDAGVLDPSKPVYVGNLWFDRSGSDENPHLDLEEFTPELGFEIEQWIDDTIYAVKHDEDASRDVAAPVCEVICEFFTVCRGTLPDQNADVITDQSVIDAVRAYREGMELEKQGKALKRDSKAMLEGISGMADGFQIRWTYVGDSEVAATIRQGHHRLDVRPARKG